MVDRDDASRPQDDAALLRRALACELSGDLGCALALIGRLQGDRSRAAVAAPPLDHPPAGGGERRIA